MNGDARTAPRFGLGSRLYLWLLPSVLVPLSLPSELRALAVIAYDLFLLAAFALDARHLARARLVMVREPAPRTHAGDVATYTLCLENRGSSAFHVTLADDTGDAVSLAPQSWHGKLAAHAHWEAKLHVRTHARGPLTLGPAHIHVESALGLARIGRAIGESQQLTVLPAETPRPARRDGAAAEGLGLIARGRFRGPRSEHLEGLRRYRAGDQRRDVDAKASAKHGTPVVRTYRSEHDEPLWLVIDVSRSMLRTTDDDTQRAYADIAVSAAVELCERAIGGGRRVGLLAFDVGLRAAVRPHSGPGQRRRLLDALARIDASTHPLDPDSMYHELRRHMRGRAELAVISALNADAQTAPLLRALRALAQRQRVHCIAIGETHSGPHDLLPLADEHALFTRAARLDLRDAERARWLRLERAGIPVHYFADAARVRRARQHDGNAQT